MIECNGQPVAKVSDSPGKTVSKDARYLAYLRQVFGLEPSPAFEARAAPRAAVAVLATVFLLQPAGARQRRHLRGVPAAAGARVRLGALAAHQRVFACTCWSAAFIAPLAGTLFDRFGPRLTYSAGLLCLVGGVLAGRDARQPVGVLPLRRGHDRRRRRPGRHGAGFRAAHALVPGAPVDRRSASRSRPPAWADCCSCRCRSG